MGLRDLFGWLPFEVATTHYAGWEIALDYQDTPLIRPAEHTPAVSAEELRTRIIGIVSASDSMVVQPGDGDDLEVSWVPAGYDWHGGFLGLIRRQPYRIRLTLNARRKRVTATMPNWRHVEQHEVVNPDNLREGNLAPDWVARDFARFTLGTIEMRQRLTEAVTASGWSWKQRRSKLRRLPLLV